MTKEKKKAKKNPPKPPSTQDEWQTYTEKGKKYQKTPYR